MAILLAACPIMAQAAAPFACAVEDRDGFATADDAGKITGAAPELCQKLAKSLGADASGVGLIVVEPDTGGPLPASDVAFVSAELLAERGLADAIVAGPTVFNDPVVVVVPDASGLHAPSDLAGKVVCLMIGSPANRALETYFEGKPRAPIRQPFREFVEMLDAYNVGQCDATVVERSRLADMEVDSGINHLKNRVLDETIGESPIFAVVDASHKADAARIFAALPTK